MGHAVKSSDVAQWLGELRGFGAESAGLEVKAATRKLPDSAVESLCAFANTPGGGALLLGIDEAAGFAVTGVADAAKIQQDLASVCRDALEPPLTPACSLVEAEGQVVVVAEVAELPRQQKPCYVKSRGMNRGTYLRVADGDRRLTPEEVQQLVADRGQPTFDREIVPEASADDLDPAAVTSYLARLRAANERPFRGEPDDAVLRMNSVVKRDDAGNDRPTLAGLLAFGRFPQQFFPQLNLTFVHYPTTTGVAMADDVRFLDNVRIDGSIPVIVADALAVIRRNMTRRAVVTAQGREDIWEYPPEALREAIVNALVHRDYSPGSRGMQVQVELYPDRLRILNAGGLFGSVDVTRLGEEGLSVTRNALLMRLLEDVEEPGQRRTVCENRGSGIRQMLAAFRRAGIEPPVFADRVTRFEVTMPSHTLFDEETLRWLSSVVGDQLTASQRTALALLRAGGSIDNARYRAATGVTDSRIATRELQDLVARGLVAQTGARRAARYTLPESIAEPAVAPAGSGADRHQEILDLLRRRGPLSKAAIAEALGITAKGAEYWLRRLKEAGSIVPLGTGRRTRYQLR